MAFAAPLSAKARRCGINFLLAASGLNSFSQNLTVLTAPSEREPLAWREGFRLKCKVCGRARSPLGELSRSD